MKKIIAVILSSFLLLLFFGCQTNKANDNENSADTHKQISSEEMSSDLPSSSDNELSGIGELSFTVSLNVFTVDGDGVDSCGYKADIPKDGTMTLRVSTSVAPDSKMIQENIPVRLWVIADDEPVEFGLDPAEEQNIYQDIMVDAGIEKLINIVFDVKKEINNLFIWCFPFPEEPVDPGVFGSFDGACSYCVVNTSCDSDENSEDTAKEIDSYLDSDGALYDDHGFVIGKKSIDENNDRISESYLFEPIALSASDRRLYLKFNPAASKEFQAETDMPYYIAVLRDGELDIFDGEYSCKVDCLAGERSFQYQIPEEYIPQSGLHTFQAMELCIILPIMWNFSDTILLRKTPKSWTTRCQRYPV